MQRIALKSANLSITCNLTTAMNGAMVHAGNLMHEPSLELVECHRRTDLRVLAAFRQVPTRRSRQEPGRALHRSDDALDMAAPVQRSWRAISKLNPLLSHSSAQCKTDVKPSCLQERVFSRPRKFASWAAELHRPWVTSNGSSRRRPAGQLRRSSRDAIDAGNGDGAHATALRSFGVLTRFAALAVIVTIPAIRRIPR